MSALPPQRPPVNSLGKFPEPVRAAYAVYQQTADPDALDLVVMAVVRDFIPKSLGIAAESPLTEGSRLVADLGFDSLALSETVFFLEDLFNVRISNAEIMEVRTVGELRQFVRRKLASTSAQSV